MKEGSTLFAINILNEISVRLQCWVFLIGSCEWGNSKLYAQTQKIEAKKYKTTLPLIGPAKTGAKISLKAHIKY